MLSNVSWGQFMTGLFVLLIIYYLVVAGYLKKDVAALLSKLRKKGNPANSSTETARLTVEQLEGIVGELRTNVFDHIRHSGTKEELLSLLQAHLTEHPGINNKAARYALGNAIMQIAAETCGIQIDETDLNRLWNKI